MTGILDHDGAAAAQPRVLVPNIAALRGLRFYYGAVAYNSVEGIKQVSNLCAVTVE